MLAGLHTRPLSAYIGSGGTLKGVVRVLKAQRQDTKVVVCEPDNSPILGNGIAQSRHPDRTRSTIIRPFVRTSCKADRPISFPCWPRMQ